jgi:hypothetical protein
MAIRTHGSLDVGLPPGTNFFHYGSSDFAKEMLGLAGFRERVDKGGPADLACDISRQRANQRLPAKHVQTAMRCSTARCKVALAIAPTAPMIARQDWLRREAKAVLGKEDRDGTSWLGRT